uniref:Uncharacterized protein n=1 Tax=Rosa rugosa TaxID=74645 RepID=J7FY79_ROSRU|nr:hypothetical protein [Rosa rugosa]
MLYRGRHGVKLSTTPGAGLHGALTERGGICFHESGSLVDGIGRKADIAGRRRGRGSDEGDPYAIGVRQTCGLTEDMSGPRGAHWPQNKRRGHVLGKTACPLKDCPTGWNMPWSHDSHQEENMVALLDGKGHKASMACQVMPMRRSMRACVAQEPSGLHEGYSRGKTRRQVVSMSRVSCTSDAHEVQDENKCCLWVHWVVPVMPQDEVSGHMLSSKPNAESDDDITPLLSSVAAGSLACLELLIQVLYKIRFLSLKDKEIQFAGVDVKYEEIIEANSTGSSSMIFRIVRMFGWEFEIIIFLQIAVDILKIVSELESPKNDFSRITYDFSKLQVMESTCGFHLLLECAYPSGKENKSFSNFDIPANQTGPYIVLDLGDKSPLYCKEHEIFFEEKRKNYKEHEITTPLPSFLWQMEVALRQTLQVEWKREMSKDLPDLLLVLFSSVCGLVWQCIVIDFPAFNDLCSYMTPKTRIKVLLEEAHDWKLPTPCKPIPQVVDPGLLRDTCPFRPIHRLTKNNFILDDQGYDYGSPDYLSLDEYASFYDCRSKIDSLSHTLSILKKNSAFISSLKFIVFTNSSMFSFESEGFQCLEMEYNFGCR